MAAARGFNLLTAVLAASILVACTGDPPPVLYPPLTLQEELRIRNPSEAGSGLVVGGAEVGRDGSLYLVDATQRQILVFDSTGRFTLAIGRGGDQAGEFGMIGSIGLIGDTVWASDPRLGRLTLFTPDGKVLRSMDNSEPLTAVGINRYSLLGILHDGSRLIGITPANLDQDAGADRSVPFIRVTKQGRADTLFDLPIPGAFVVGAGNATRYIQQPFEERHTIGVRRDGGAWIVVERAAGDRGPASVIITRYSLEAGKEWSKLVLVNPVRIPRGVKDSIVSDATSNPEQAAQLRDWLHVPRRMPLVDAAMFSDDGTIWLNEASRSTTARWIRVDSTGVANGALTVPQSWGVLYASATRLWIFQKDRAGLPSVVRYRVH